MLAIIMLVKTGSCQSKCEQSEKAQATEAVNVSKGYMDYFNMKLYSILELLYHTIRMESQNICLFILFTTLKLHNLMNGFILLIQNIRKTIYLIK